MCMGRGDHFRQVTDSELIAAFETAKQDHNRQAFTYTELSEYVPIEPESVRQRLQRLAQEDKVNSQDIGTTVLWHKADDNVWA